MLGAGSPISGINPAAALSIDYAPREPTGLRVEIGGQATTQQLVKVSFQFSATIPLKKGSFINLGMPVYSEDSHPFVLGSLGSLKDQGGQELIEVNCTTDTPLQTTLICHYDPQNGSLRIDPRIEEDIRPGTRIKLNLFKVLLPPTTSPYNLDFEVTDTQGPYLVKNSVALEFDAKKFTFLNLYPIPNSPPGRMGIAVDFEYDIAGAEDGCAYELAAVTESLNFTEIGVEGYTKILAETKRALFAGPCPEKGRPLQAFFTNINNSKSSNSSQLTFSVWDKRLIEGEYKLGKAQESYPVKIGDKFVSSSSSFYLSSKPYYFGTPGTIYIQISSVQNIPKNSNIYIHTGPYLEKASDLTCYLEYYGTRTCKYEKKGVIKLEDPLNGSTSVRYNYLRIQISNIIFPFCSVGDIRLQFAIKDV